jgi:hypothetical protein
VIGREGLIAAARNAVASTLVGLVVVGCGGASASPGSSASPGPIAPTGSVVPSSSFGPTPPASTAPRTPASGSPVETLVVDATLLGLLPERVDDVALTDDPTTAASIASDPDLARHASAIAVAYAIAPGTSTSDDVGVASLVRLRPGAFDPAFFRSWIDTYDRAACAVAGGLSGHAQATIGGHRVDIGSCAAGAHTYHVYLEGRDTIVSVTGLGPRRFGELIVAGLRE